MAPRFPQPAVLLSIIFILLDSAAMAATEFNGGALRVFVDCHERCDMDFLRQEIRYINYVRDQRDAQVHVLVTQQRNAAGREFNLALFGLEEFEGINQTVSYSNSRMDSRDQRRRRMARVLQLSLVPYVLQTPYGEGLSIAYEAPDEEELLVQEEQEDRWNYWVFQTQAQGQFESEDRRDHEEYQLAFSASRTTDAWRLWAGTWNRQRERNFEFDDGSTLKDISTESSAGASAIRSFGDHWGAGLGYRRKTSTFLNLERVDRLAAAVEYNLFPYSESSERQLKVGYFISSNQLDYDELTVFGVTSESMADHGLYMEYDVDRQWGSVSFDIGASHFLEDTSLYRVSIGGDLSYRIARGLEISLWAESSIVQDQIYLPAGGTTDEDVLLGRRALDTGAETQYGLRLRYSFGSIYNNVVNNRLEGSGFTDIF